MPEFTTTRQIAAPVETVWAVLDDFGDIQRWNPGVTSSALTSVGPVTEGTTRHCDLKPFGGVNERILQHTPYERLTVNIYETFSLPISDSIADFNIAPFGDGTELTLHYSYTLNRLGRLQRGPPTSNYAGGSEAWPTVFNERANASQSIRRASPSTPTVGGPSRPDQPGTPVQA